MPLGELLQETLELQARRVPDAKSEVMRRRRELVEREIPAWMQHEPLPYPEWRTGGSSGKGGPAEIPWSRCFDPELSPKAGVGWYIVYLFAADGSAVYLSLNQGTTTWDTSKKDFVFKSTADLRSRVEWARSVVQPSRLATDIDLRANGQLGRWYQAGNVWAVEYRLDEIPSETVLKADFAKMTALLVDLYEADLEKVDYAGRAVPEVEDNDETTGSVHVNVEVPTATATFSASGTLEVTTEVMADITVTRSRLLVPAIADDDTSGPDQLGIARDARALAGLMASRELRPPLAVAIYGEWGSGKTFFMRQIEANIVRLAAGDTTLFEPAVRHIRFGAWHYAQGNLWASLLSHIFATLCPPASASEQMLAAATAKIESIQNTLQSADVRVAAIESRAEQIEDEIKKTQERHEGILESLKAVRKKDIWAGISTDEELQRRVEGAANDLGVPVAADGARALFEAAQEVLPLPLERNFLLQREIRRASLAS
ncbi:MrcB family domain-containing protein [Nocardia asteroides]